MDFNNIKPLLELIGKVNESLKVITPFVSVPEEATISSLLPQGFIGSYYGLTKEQNNIWIGYWEKCGYCFSFHTNEAKNFSVIENKLVADYGGYCICLDATRGGRWYTIQLNSLNSNTNNEVQDAYDKIKEIINNIKDYL